MYYIYYMFNIVSWFLIGWFDSYIAVAQLLHSTVFHREK